MSDLQNLLISKTFHGLLHTSDQAALPDSGVKQIQDGTGNDSALSLGKSGQGANINGNFNATGSSITLSALNVLTLSGGNVVRMTGKGVVIAGGSNATTVQGTFIVNGSSTVQDSTTILGNTTIHGNGGTVSLGGGTPTDTVILQSPTIKYGKYALPVHKGKIYSITDGVTGQAEFVSIDSVRSNAANVCTTTRFLSSPGGTLPNPHPFTLPDDNDWHPIDVSSGLSDDARGGVFFIRIAPEVDLEDNTLKVNKNLFLVVSQEPSGANRQQIPIAYHYFYGNPGIPGGRFGTQFQCPIRPGSGSGGNTFSIRNVGDSGIGPLKFEIYVIASLV